MTAPLTPFRTLPEVHQEALRETWAEESARDSCGASFEEKITRFAAWLEPQGISFTFEDLPQREV